MLAFENGLSHLARALPDLLHGRIVIFDRYVLDSAVRLRFLYGEHRSFGFQRRLIRLLSPKPRHSYWLDVSPETVLARKELQFDLDELRRQARLYGEEHLKLDVTRIDGERPREDVCAEIAAEVWLSLHG